MRMYMAAAAAVTAALLLTSCSAINEGRVTDKLYSAPHDVTTTECYMWRPATKTMPGGCAGYHQVTRHYDAEYRFNIADDKDTGWVYVTQHTFEAYEVGDWYGEEN